MQSHRKSSILDFQISFASSHPKQKKYQHLACTDNHRHAQSYYQHRIEILYFKMCIIIVFLSDGEMMPNVLRCQLTY